MNISRRDILVGAGALGASALAACSGVTSTVMPSGGPTVAPSPPAEVDVIVVGAGAAGIGAARTILSYGRSVLLLEAQDRVGGRAHTDNTTFPSTPFDLGAQLFQQVLSGNVLYQIARARNVRGIFDFTSFPTYFYLGDNEAPPKAETEFLATTASMLGALLAAGATISSPSHDVPVSTVTDAFKNEPFYHNALSINVLGISGVEPGQSSLLDLYQFLQVSPAPFVVPGDTFFVQSGVGNFITGLAKGLPVHVGMPVERIERTSLGVVVTTKAGTHRAKLVIVTASTSVLAAGGIDFKPALPSNVTDAFAEIPLGNIYKAALGFKRDIVPQFKNMTLPTALSNVPTTNFFLKYFGANIVEFLADADLAVKIESMSKSEQASFLLGQLELNLPGAASAYDGTITSSSWTSNPYTRGAYSHAKVGGVEARTSLRAGVDGTIFFAGESLALGGLHSSLHGAYTSGIAAASAGLKAIGVDVRRRPGLASFS